MKWKFATVLFLTLAIFASGASAATKYVKVGGAGNNDGDSWANAMSSTDLVASLDAHVATNTVEFWVAAGTYSPGNTAASTFNLKKGVKLYGGFPATGEPTMTARDWVANPTILSGDAGGSGNKNYHVVSSGVGATSDTGITPANTRLDGFIITGGAATGSGTGTGNGVGGGMHNNYASPTIENCTFSGNTASSAGGGYGAGGGMYNNYASPVITNSTFSGNTADGGGMYNSESSPVITNCTFSGNTAGSYGGGGMYNSGNVSSPVVVNTIFWDNTATNGNAIVHTSSSGTLTLKNCVVPTGGVVKDSSTIIETATVNSDPLLDTFSGVYYPVKDGSSAVGKGLAVGTTVSGTVTVPAKDQAGKARPASPAMTTIGAIEGIGGGGGGDIKVTGITVTPAKISLTGAQSSMLTANITPANATNQNITWTSNNSTVAEVSTGGIVKGKDVVGSATITATTADGGFTATCAVDVRTEVIAPVKPVIPDAPEDVKPATPENETNVDDAADKMTGSDLIADDLEVVNGAVRIKAEITQEIGEKMGKDRVSFDTTYELPVFTALIDKAGDVVAVGYQLKGKELLAGTPEKVQVLKIFSSTSGDIFTYQDDPKNFGDKVFTVQDKKDAIVARDAKIDTGREYKLILFIRDGGSFDLDGVANKQVVDPTSILGTPQSDTDPEDPKKRGGGGCGDGFPWNAGFFASTIFLVAPLFIIRRKRK